MKLFFSSVLAGMMIAVGGMVFLTVGSVAGSLLFGVGLLSIILFGLHLFTGKVGYLLDQKPAFLLELAVIWLGNLLGTVLTAVLFRLTRIGQNQTVMETAKKVAEVKLNDTALSMLILGTFCGLLIYIAVDTFKKSDNPIAQIVCVFMPVSVFILCGFEHVVADMFYFSMAACWSWKALFYCLMITLGNTLGALLIPLLKKIPQQQGQAH